MTRGRFLGIFVAVLFCCLLSASEANAKVFGQIGHNRLVRQSGVRPPQVGTHEGVGMSSVSLQDAIQRACYWGQREPISITPSYRNGKHYAVIRYR